MKQWPHICPVSWREQPWISVNKPGVWEINFKLIQTEVEWVSMGRCIMPLPLFSYLFNPELNLNSVIIQNALQHRSCSAWLRFSWLDILTEQFLLSVSSLDQRGRKVVAENLPQTTWREMEKKCISFLSLACKVCSSDTSFMKSSFCAHTTPRKTFVFLSFLLIDRDVSWFRENKGSLQAECVFQSEQIRIWTGLNRAEILAESLFGWSLQWVRDRIRTSRPHKGPSSLPNWLWGELLKLHSITD